VSAATLPEAAPAETLASRCPLARLAAVLSRPEAREAGLSIFDQAVVSGTNFVTSVVIGRAAGADGLGVYSLALSVVLLARGVQEQLVAAPYLVRCQQKRGEARATYLGSAFVHQALISAMVVAALVGLGFALGRGVGPAKLNSVVWLLAAAAPALLLREFLRQVAFGQLRPGLAVAIDATVAGVQVGGLLALTWNGVLTVPGAFAVMASGCLFAVAGWFFAQPVPVRFGRREVRKDWRENWAFGRWALASQLVGGAGLYVMPWVVAAVDGERATGLLAAGGTLVGIANMFVTGLANYLSPKAARAYADGGTAVLRPVLRMTAVVFTAFLGTFAVGAIVAGGLAADLVYGKGFAAAGPVVGVLAFGLWVNSMAITAGNGLWAVGKPEANFRADLVGLLVTTFATVTLVPLLGGPIGAASSLLAGGASDALVRTAILRRVLRERSAAEGR
jgi:O-antigen/teichoic acid export membrane protein